MLSSQKDWRHHAESHQGDDRRIREIGEVGRRGGEERENLPTTRVPRLARTHRRATARNGAHVV